MDTNTKQATEKPTGDQKAVPTGFVIFDEVNDRQPSGVDGYVTRQTRAIFPGDVRHG
jgi:hypothetical protein